MRKLLLLPVMLAVFVGFAAEPAKASIPSCPWAMGPAASGPRPKPVGVLTYGAIGLQTNLYHGQSMQGMVNGTDPGLTYGPAIYPSSKAFGKLPGRGKVVGIAGHRTTRFHPFCTINLAKPGQYVTLRVGGWIWIYRVVCVNPLTDPYDWSYFQHPERCDTGRKLTAKSRFKYLAMGACTPPQTANYRINVVARLVGRRRAVLPRKDVPRRRGW